MADTKPVLLIPQTWINVNVLSGVAEGIAITVQNVGMAGDVISLANSPTQPVDNFTGVAVAQYKETMLVTEGESILWARFYRPNAQYNYTQQGRIQVQVLT